MTKWVSENLHNSLITSKFLNMVDHCVNNGFEKILIDIFIKLNLVGTINNVFDGICVDGVYYDNTDDQVIFVIREIVRILYQCKTSKEKFGELSRILKKSITYRHLVEKVL